MQVALRHGMRLSRYRRCVGSNGNIISLGPRRLSLFTTLIDIESRFIPPISRKMILPTTRAAVHHYHFHTSSIVQNYKSTDVWEDFYKSHGPQLEVLPEVIAMQRLELFLQQQISSNNDNKSPPRHPSSPSSRTSSAYKNAYTHEMTSSQMKTCLDAAMMTFLVHVYARKASMVGQGFYTIGPCGEELLAGAALALQEHDSLALHYRHLAISMARQLSSSQTTLSSLSSSQSIETDDDVNERVKDILLARARGYTVSRNDPVTGGVHCAIGGGPNDYIVTSTLASQCPPAVGRALAYGLIKNGGNCATGRSDSRNKRPISMCTIGDGSVHNGHFWSAWTLARHAKHLGIKCPFVMGISDNGLSISYETKGFVNRLFGGGNGTPKQSYGGEPLNMIDDNLVPVFRANGQDLLDVYDQSVKATTHARTYGSPVLILYSNLVRRFGHAATDRQAAYLDKATIDTMADTDVLQNSMVQVVEQQNATTYTELLDRYQELQQLTKEAFATAIQEPKVTLEDMMERVVPPLVEVPFRTRVEPTSSSKDVSDRETPSATTTTSQNNHFVATILTNASPTIINANVPAIEKPQVLRKHMTRVFDEIMTEDPSVVYMGEDVEHGGYYLVTEGLADRFPGRIMDFPPDETSLLGAALGFRQVGNVVPIVELPYAKYLDCGVDMFYEIALMNWLSNKKTKNNSDKDDKSLTLPGLNNTGMVIRLQGFDRGVFGGNFHTHNMLSHIPPGVDIVCFSNGPDYVQGMRHAVLQAKEAGRIVVSVDCTHLLNLRHLHETGDRGWEQPYPSLGVEGDDSDRYLGFDGVRRYRHSEDGSVPPSLAIISYGNGVVGALQARRSLVESGVLATEAELDVVDCPYISGVPKGLEQALKDYSKVVFADICKEGPGSNVFSSMVMSLQESRSLPPKWSFVGAPRTYNPLGSTVTFLNKERIEEAVKRLVG